MEFKHTPVLLNEVTQLMRINPSGIYVDGTTGGGGHSLEIAKRLEGGRLVCIDKDEEALNAAKERLSGYKNVSFAHASFSDTGEVLRSIGAEKADGILLDIGVSSYQIDNPERGFSYKEDAPLDMRMDKASSLTAKDIVNTYSREELSRIIKTYGEESFAANIAKHIVNERENGEIKTTRQLFEIIKGAIPAKVRGGGPGFAKKTFQALRIEVNGELDVLKESVEKLIRLLNPQGRLLIISFHSLEDRIVKNEFKRAENPCTCPPDFPVCVCGKVSLGRTVTKKPVTPTADECAANKRAKSAKLRVFERGN